MYILIVQSAYSKPGTNRLRDDAKWIIYLLKNLVQVLAWITWPCRNASGEARMACSGARNAVARACASMGLEALAACCTVLRAAAQPSTSPVFTSSAASDAKIPAHQCS